MMLRALALPLAACLLTIAGFAATAPADNPYADQRGRAIKALSDDDVAALLKGEGIGLAKAAELNGYPGPRHVLDLADELRLTTNQRQQVQAIFNRMRLAAKPIGAELVERERALDQLFHTGGITADRLAAETTGLGDLQGRLRSVHLVAHLETRALLGPDQIAAYQRLRGYAAPTAPHHHH